MGVDNDDVGKLDIDDDILRRDSLHAVINSLPDPNYATLRALILVCFLFPHLFFPLFNSLFLAHLSSYYLGGLEVRG